MENRESLAHSSGLSLNLLADELFINLGDVAFVALDDLNRRRRHRRLGYGHPFDLGGEHRHGRFRLLLAGGHANCGDPPSSGVPGVSPTPLVRASPACVWTPF